MKHVIVGLLAHVDAGKTTLSEGLLYASGMIRRMGRVDRQDAYLDTDAMERERGITIFSKQARITCGDCQITLVDTPGHVDFSAEMERTLPVLDYAILVISGLDGVQGHTETLWRLLEEYRIPVFLFVNKMDQSGKDRREILLELKRRLSDACIALEEEESFQEEAALCGEEAMQTYLDTGKVDDGLICRMIAERALFPCCFGSALKNAGVEAFLQGICRFTLQKEYPEEFGARVFKITRDEAGQRLTWMKLTGGSLNVRAPLRGANGEWEEKVSQIRIYSGAKYETVSHAYAGEICAVTGLSKTYAGEGLGAQPSSFPPLLDAALAYRIQLPSGCDPIQALPKFRQLEEEDPLLHIVWNETHREIIVQVMGEVQMEVLKRQAADRFGLAIAFDAGHILYKETIVNTVEGVGHFEPLRHYAEVHLLLAPGARGSGLICKTDCSEDLLDRNWQRLILTHLREKEHLGVLTGSAITDMSITVVSGRAHPKHTEGGDFRQAAYRAVRQGLRQAESALLEPYYAFRLDVPETCVGRAMTDIERCGGTMEGPEITDGRAMLSGKAPVCALREYAKEVAAYTKGSGRLSLSYGGYEICRNADEVIAQIGYDVDADVQNTADSVFCSHGAGHIVAWDRVPEAMHLESALSQKTGAQEADASVRAQHAAEEEWIDVEEVDAILKRAYGANMREASADRRRYKTAGRIAASQAERRRAPKEDAREAYLLVDGYNILYAWKELRELLDESMDGARGRLLDLLCDYQGMKGCQVIVVFDAYRVAGHTTEFFDYHNIHVVYTKEAETADAYIEKFAHAHGKKYRITVATSDGLEQIIIRGAGCLLISATELQEEFLLLKRSMEEEHGQKQENSRSYFFDGMSKEVRQQIKETFTERKEAE